MKRAIFLGIFSAFCLCFLVQTSSACTGITLHTQDNQTVVARTIEWALQPLNSGYVVVPRGYKQQSFLPDGTQSGLLFRAKYGYVGLTVEQPEFVMEGINEMGLSAGLFYFPNYGRYVNYDSEKKDQTIGDFQLVAWILSQFSTIEEVKEALPSVSIVSIDPRSSTVHWRIAEPSGKQVVLEIIDGQINLMENTLGVLTNAPDFRWHLTNLNNYTNLKAGNVPSAQIGELQLKAFGGGAGLHGVPGDMTPPSRFVRAALFQSTAPKLATTQETVVQAFHLLNNFDIPVGIQFENQKDIPNQPSATQWTVASDLSGRCIYFRTMYDATIRCIDLTTINFRRITFRSEPLDVVKTQPIQYLQIK